jgi:hypothetical protein
MKKFGFLFVILAAALHGAFAQGTIQSIVPNAALKGQIVEIVIRGAGTTFQIGAVTVDLGQGVLIQNVNVNNSFTLAVTAEIQSTATPGFRDLTILSSGQTIQMMSAFEILDAGGNAVFAILEINPVQVLYASDFDPDNLASAPLVFRVTVLNDQQTRDLKTYFFLILEGEGLILTAIKNMPQTQPGAVTTFDNREFDEFEINEENTGIATQIMATGVLPPGIYTYQIEVRQGNQVLATASGQNALLNQVGDLIIISPGSPASDGTPPQTQLASQPLFQWISTANQFDLFLYEVGEGQTNVQEIVQQLPVYREFSIPGNTFLYPLSAEPLVQGKTYAWQLRAYFNNPGGNGFFDGPLYWFTYDANAGFTVPIGSIEIVPDYLDTETGAYHQFTAIVKDLQGNVMEVTPTWTVLPDPSFGTITETGKFNAGKNPRIGAVMASYGAYSTHCLVNLEFSGFGFNLLELLFKNAEYRVYQYEKH